MTDTQWHLVPNISMWDKVKHFFFIHQWLTFVKNTPIDIKETPDGFTYTIKIEHLIPQVAFSECIICKKRKYPSV